MAPEEGLEPSTSRLTAACSTIELLWSRRPPLAGCFPAENRSTGTRNLQTEVPIVKRFCLFLGCLALGAVKRAAGGLNHSLDPAPTTQARLSLPVINLQTLLVIIL